MPRRLVDELVNADEESRGKPTEDQAPQPPASSPCQAPPGYWDEEEGSPPRTNLRPSRNDRPSAVRSEPAGPAMDVVLLLLPCAGVVAGLVAVVLGFTALVNGEVALTPGGCCGVARRASWAWAASGSGPRWSATSC